MKPTYRLFGIDYASADGDAVFIEAEMLDDGRLKIIRELRVPAIPSVPSEGVER
jgi:hypothetical protein